MKIEFEFIINDIRLGIKEAEDPKDDRSQYLVIDDFKIHIVKDNKIYISIKKHHIKEYEAGYCVDCLKEGIRNTKTPYGHWSKTEKWDRCIDHYAAYMREKDPQNACPKCEKGYLTTCGVEGENRCCTHCEHRIHRELYPRIFGEFLPRFNFIYTPHFQSSLGKVNKDG